MKLVVLYPGGVPFSRLSERAGKAAARRHNVSGDAATSTGDAGASAPVSAFSLLAITGAVQETGGNMKTLHGLLVAASFVGMALTSRAEDLELQTLRPPSPSDAQLLGTHTARQGPSRSLSLGLSLSYLNDPLVLVDGSGKRVASLVGDQLSAELAAAYAVTERIELGAALPLILYQDTGSRGAITVDDAALAWATRA